MQPFYLFLVGEVDTSYAPLRNKLSTGGTARALGCCRDRELQLLIRDFAIANRPRPSDRSTLQSLSASPHPQQTSALRTSPWRASVPCWCCWSCGLRLSLTCSKHEQWSHARLQWSTSLCLCPSHLRHPSKILVRIGRSWSRNKPAVQPSHLVPVRPGQRNPEQLLPSAAEPRQPPTQTS